MNSSFPRQLSISAAALVLFLLPLLYAGDHNAQLSEDNIDRTGISVNAGDFTFSKTVSGLDLYSPEDFAKYIVVSESEDIGLALYDDPAYRDLIIRYYEAITGSYDIADTALRYAKANGISFTLAVALMWAESSFDPEAYNKNAVSIDRGLYQLNSESFPEMSREQFYNIETNISTGLSYLRYCIDLGGSEIVALAIYNAGHGRVSGAGAPLITLEYISRIMDYKSELERDFERYISQNGKIRADKKSEKNLIPVKKINSKIDMIKD